MLGVSFHVKAYWDDITEAPSPQTVSASKHGTVSFLSWEASTYAVTVHINSATSKG